MNKNITPKTARSLLISLLIFIILAAGAGFYVGLREVSTIATEVTHASQDAAAGIEQVKGLQNLQVQLGETRTLVDKANTMFVPVADYQARVLNDLRVYAAEAKITIVNTDFVEDPTAASDPIPTRSVKITLAQPVSYASLLRFLQLTEGSLPKLTVAGVTISREADMKSDEVKVEPITLRISVK
jgi:hypothetical protein